MGSHWNTSVPSRAGSEWKSSATSHGRWKRTEPSSRKGQYSMTKAPPDEYNEFIGACADLLGRTGAKGFELRYSDGDDEGDTVVWMVIADFGRSEEHTSELQSLRH